MPARATRPRVRLLASLSTLLAIGLFTPALVQAATTEEVAARTASDFKQSCTKNTGNVTCSGPSSRVHVWLAVIAPASGPVVTLRTDATMFGVPPMDAASRTWMNVLHGLACGSDKGAAAYVAKVAVLSKPAPVPAETVGVCRMAGSMDLDPQGRERYRVTSSIRVQPTPAPTVAPTPTPVITSPPRPTPTPATTTPPPTLPPTLPPTGPSAGPGASATATPEASVMPSPSPVESPSAEPSASPTPAGPPPTGPPAPTVGPGSTTEPPASGAPGAATPTPTLPTFSQSVLGITDVNADGGALGGSILLALLLLLLIAFAGELFNNTVENNDDVIKGWFRKGPLGVLRRLRERITFDPPGRPGVLVFIALTALISSFVDPSFGLDVRSVAVFLGFLVGLIVVLASFKLPPILARRRRTGEMGQLKPLPWALVVAALFVVVSRLENLQPGYLYGIVLGAIFVSDASDRDEGRETFYGSLWTLGAALLAWIGLTWLRGLGLPEDGFGATLLGTAFAATLVAGLEAAAFGLMPMRFLPGHAVYRWNRLGWALLFGLSCFAFIHILIGPTSGYVAELSPNAFVAALGVFAAFGALSIGTWLYFRLRARGAPADPVEAT